MSQARILVVDDDDALRDLIRNQLEGAGYLLDDANDGASAMEKLGKGTYDLMLLDINMPEKSGIDVLRFWKEKGLKCKIIMLTGRVGFSIATESLRLGADEYITKPFSLEYLMSSIKRVLEKRDSPA
jgi:DNA-binding response OmpR family regulator